VGCAVTKPSSDFRIFVTYSRRNFLINPGLLLEWADNFVYAGLSAALLITANLFPEYWYLDLIALIPFIYRLSKMPGTQTWKLGLLFSLCYFGVLSIDSFLIAPLSTLGQIIIAIFLFTTFTGMVGWIKKLFGFNPIFISFLWTILEYALIRLGISNGLFNEIGISAPLFGMLSTVFGFVIISFIIVLSNTILILFLGKIGEILSDANPTIPLGERGWNIWFQCEVRGENNFLIPEVRGPPA